MHFKQTAFIVRNLEQSAVRKREPLPAIQRRNQQTISRNDAQNVIEVPHEEYKNNWIKDPAVDPRDIKINLPSSQLDNLFTNDFGEHQRNVLRKWLVKLYENLCSDGFYRYNNQQFTRGQFKAYISKNVIYHINLVFDKIGVKVNQSVRQQIMNFLNQQSEQIFNYIILKYPQESIKSTYRRIKNKMPKVDIRAKDTYDMLRYMPEKLNFSWNLDNDYTQEIMKMINYLIDLPSSTAKDKNQDYTMFQAFQTLLQTMIFTKKNVNVEEIMNQYLKQFRDFELSEFKSFFDPYLQKQANSDIYLRINQKIQPSTKTFTNQQIQNNQFRVLDAPVLRILTKWAQQLQIKLKDARKLYFDKSLKFKLKNGTDEFLTDATIKAVIQKSEKHWSQIGYFFSQIKNNLINMQEQLFTHQFQGKYVNNVDTNVAIFAARTQSCLGQYLLHYINKLLHAIASIPKQLGEIASIREQYYTKRQQQQQKKRGSQESSQQIKAKQVLIPERLKFDFVTFKIGDLMRARCKARQQTIISILNTMEVYSQKIPHILKIIRVKDRLDKKDNDILVNLFFMNKVLCQIQFSVTKQSNKKGQNYNDFNHFIYQLTRTKFGPIAECACIAIQYDPFSKHISQRKNILPDVLKFNSVKKFHKQIIKEAAENKRQLLKKESQVYKQKGLNIFPYFCSSKCGMLIKNTNPGLFAQKLITSLFKQCNSCHIDRIFQQRGQEQLLQYIFQNKFRSQQIKTINSHFSFCSNLQDFQQFLQEVDYINTNSSSGRGFAFKKSEKSLKPIYFRIVKQEQNSCFLMTSFENQKIKILFEIPSTTQIDKQVHNQTVKKLFQIFFIVFLNHRGHQASIVNTQIQNQKQPSQISHQQTLRCQFCQTNVIQLATYKGKYAQQIVRSQNLKQLNRMISQRKQEYVGTLKSITNQFELLSSYKPLKVLKVSSNSISNADFINKFPSLILLDLSQNLIKQLPDFVNNRKIKELRIRDNQIKSLRPLSILNQLQFLDTSANSIENFEGLQGCEKLKQIVAVQLNCINTYKDLQKVKSLQIFQFSTSSMGNFSQQVNDLTSFGQLPKMTSLDIDGIYTINSIKGLQNFSLLQKLSIRRASLYSSNVSQQQQKPQGQLVPDSDKAEFSQKLKEVILEQCTISELIGFQKFKNVQKLNLSYNQIYSLKGLQLTTTLLQLTAKSNLIQNVQGLQCTRLTFLNLQQNRLISLKGIQKLRNLVGLNVSVNSLQSLQGLNDHPLLQFLDISMNQVTSFQGTQNLLSLKKLKCEENQLSSFKGLQRSINIQSITASFNKITTLQHLQKMNKMLQLSLERNQIINFTGLQNMKRLKVLIAKKNSLVSIEGIQNCISLTKLDIIQNSVSSLEPLSMIQSLEWLGFQNNQVVSLKGCDKLRNLERLFGKFNKLTQVTQIRGMKKVQIINIGDNLISSLQGIQNLPSLAQLAIQNCQLTSLAGLKNLPKLKKLFFKFNKIQSLEQLQCIKDSIDLKILVMQNNKLKSIKGVEHFINLQEFAIKSNQIVSLEGIEPLKNVKKLYFDFNQIQSLEPCKNFTKIQLLGLMNNKTTQLSGISKSIHCKQLYLHDNPLISIEGLRNYERLTLLVIQNCQLASLKGLQNITSMERLYILNTKIQSVAQLRNMTKVNILSMGQNKIRSLKGIQNMKSLYSLNFNNNQVESLVQIRTMTWITSIRLDNNKLQSLDGIQDICNLRSLDIYNNPLKNIEVLKLPNVYQYLVINGVYKDSYIEAFKPFQQPQQKNEQPAAPQNT